MIKRIELTNFRSHANTSVDCEQVTVLLGPTGSGKTSVIDGLAYALAGANQFTSRDGKQAQNLIRLGSEDEKLRVTIETDQWAVERSRAAKSITLMVSGSTAATVPQNQALIFDRLGIGAEALLALLDAKPLLSRTAADQHSILCRLLPPPEINLSQRLIAAGVPKPMGIEHLDKIIKEWKEDRLRDLNRERKKIEGSQTAPIWPLEGYTENDVNANYQAVMKERDKVLGEKALLDVLISQDEKTLNEPEPIVTEADPKRIATLQQQVETARAKLADWQKDSNERSKAIDRMATELSAKQQHAADLYQTVTAQAVLPHCPTCTCKTSDVPEVSRELQALEDEIEKLQVSLKADTSAELTATTAITKAQEDLRRFELDLRTEEAIQNRAQKSREPRAATEGRLKDSREREGRMLAALEALDARLQKGKAFQDQIAKYKAEFAAAQQQAKRYIDLTREHIPAAERVIGELEALRESLLQQHVGGFLADMQKTLDSFGLSSLSYDVEKGFFFADLDANYLSTGQANMLFEVAFRIAAAKRTGLNLVVLDHVAPVDEAHRAKIQEALLGSACQVLMTWTMSEKPRNTAPNGVRRYWCELTPAGTVLSVV